MRHPEYMVEMASNLIKNGFSCGDTSLRLKEIYGFTVSKATVSSWAKKKGIIFQGRSRYKPCTFCSSRTLHKHNCPLFKILYEDSKKREEFTLIDNLVSQFVNPSYIDGNNSDV